MLAVTSETFLCKRAICRWSFADDIGDATFHLKARYLVSALTRRHKVAASCRGRQSRSKSHEHLQLQICAAALIGIYERRPSLFGYCLALLFPAHLQCMESNGVIANRFRRKQIELNGSRAKECRQHLLLSPLSGSSPCRRVLKQKPVRC